MKVAISTRKKLSKPSPEFPLFAHNNGQWCRKNRGKLYSFGKWEEPTIALEMHNAEYAYLKEGIAPAQSFDGWRVGDLINEYLSVEEDRLDHVKSSNAHLMLWSTSASWCLNSFPSIEPLSHCAGRLPKAAIGNDEAMRTDQYWGQHVPKGSNGTRNDVTMWVP